jgi:hypothetical protein
MRTITKDQAYVEYSEEDCGWGVFDNETGFCFTILSSETEALNYMKNLVIKDVGDY